ncbi:hypothetical protein EV2_009684 [Malus domestica]
MHHRFITANPIGVQHILKTNFPNYQKGQRASGFELTSSAMTFSTPMEMTGNSSAKSPTTSSTPSLCVNLSNKWSTLSFPTALLQFSPPPSSLQTDHLLNLFLKNNTAVTFVFVNSDLKLENHELSRAWTF